MMAVHVASKFPAMLRSTAWKDWRQEHKRGMEMFRTRISRNTFAVCACHCYSHNWAQLEKLNQNAWTPLPIKHGLTQSEEIIVSQPVSKSPLLFSSVVWIEIAETGNASSFACLLCRYRVWSFFCGKFAKKKHCAMNSAALLVSRVKFRSHANCRRGCLERVVVSVTSIESQHVFLIMAIFCRMVFGFFF